MSKGYQKP